MPTIALISHQAKASLDFDALSFACEWIGELCVFVVSFRLKMSE